MVVLNLVILVQARLHYQYLITIVKIKIASIGREATNFGLDIISPAT
jgi:hypothetical protein